MKTNGLRQMVLAIFALGMFTVASYAQPVVYTADVPFSFTVNNVTLPAGAYEIRQLTNTDAWDFVLTDAKGMTKVIFSAESAERGNRPATYELTFDEIGTDHFLSNIWLADQDTGFYVPKTKSEIAMMKKLMPMKPAHVSMKKK
jgi:hypothetical protein